MAFVAGVLPLAVSNGAGANGRIAIGTGIVGGTLAATALGIFVPLFFMLAKRGFEEKRRESSQQPSPVRALRSHSA